MERRDFLKTLLVGGAALALRPLDALAERKGTGRDNIHPEKHPLESESATGRIQKIIDGLDAEGLDKLFEGEKEHLCSCIDERIPDGTFRLPGAGVMTEDPEAIAEVLLKQGITEVSSHEGCGAAAAAYKKISAREGEKPSWFVEGSADETGKKFVEEVVRIMNGKNTDKEKIVKALHLDFKHGTMVGDKHRHLAEVGYMDMTDAGFKLREALRLGMNKGFNMSNLDGDGEIDSAKLSAMIELGDHGNPRAFSKKRPFEIVILVKSGDPKTEEYRNKMENALRDLGKNADKVKVGVVNVKGL